MKPDVSAQNMSEYAVKFHQQVAAFLIAPPESIFKKLQRQHYKYYMKQ